MQKDLTLIEYTDLLNQNISDPDIKLSCPLGSSVCVFFKNHIIAQLSKK